MSRHHVGLNRRHWRRVRRRTLEQFRWTCATCGRWANEVDHVVPLTRGGPLYTGLQALCRRCHIKKTRSENRRPSPARARWRRLVEALLN